jgi:3-hydroxyisobutyrate dehydrogenase-like beta-hydroxyacid dehydrogenase
MNETPGFIGLGSMGQPMAESLLKAGYGLKVYNRTASKTEPLIAQGAEAVSLPEAVAQAGGIVVSMVSDDAALQDSVKHTGFLERLGSGGIAPSLHRMRVH